MRLRTIIGLHEWEKERQQEVLVDITIHHDQRDAARDDDVQHTIDYATLRDDLVDYASTHSHALIETLAERIAERVLKHPHVQAVDVEVEKPHALRFSQSVGVEIHRAR